MPKLKPSYSQQANMSTQAIINYGLTKTGVTKEELARRMGCELRWLNRLIQYPEKITLANVRIIVKTLKLNEQEQAKLIGVIK